MTRWPPPGGMLLFELVSTTPSPPKIRLPNLRKQRGLRLMPRQTPLARALVFLHYSHVSPQTQRSLAIEVNTERSDTR